MNNQKIINHLADAEPVFLPASATKSCDECISQQGQHYCLLHHLTVKNMDAVRCRDFRYRPAFSES